MDWKSKFLFIDNYCLQYSNRSNLLNMMNNYSALRKTLLILNINYQTTYSFAHYNAIVIRWLNIQILFNLNILTFRNQKCIQPSYILLHHKYNCMQKININYYSILFRKYSMLTKC